MKAQIVPMRRLAQWQRLADHTALHGMGIAFVIASALVLALASSRRKS